MFLSRFFVLPFVNILLLPAVRLLSFLSIVIPRCETVFEPRTFSLRYNARRSVVAAVSCPGGQLTRGQLACTVLFKVKIIKIKFA